MKSNRSLYEIAAGVLADEAKEAPDLAPDVRTQAIRAMSSAMRARKAQRRLRFLGASAALVAAAAAVVVLVVRRPNAPANAAAPHAVASSREDLAHQSPPAAASFVRGAPSVIRDGARQPLADGSSLGVGDRVVVEPGSRTTVALANGTYVAVDEHAELLLASLVPAMTFELALGAVRADVTKLGPGERFVLRTVDAEVEVRGTSFDVSIVEPDGACANGTRTRVKVREGTVAVRAGGRETLVGAGSSWPTCEAEPPPAVGRRGAEPSAVARATAHHAAGPPASELAKENDLYERALGQKRSGDPRSAVALLDELLARYPSGPLAPSARAERMKLLRDVDATRAREAARDYIKRHPNGFARRDAELILSGE